MAGSRGGRPSKPLETKRRTGRTAGTDSGGRKLPDPSNVVALPGIADRVPATPASLNTKERARTCPDVTLYEEAADGIALCQVCLAEPGRELWTELWLEGKAWLTTRSDAHLLVLQLCEGRDEERHHQAVLATHGRYVKGQRGGVVAHPGVRMLRQVRAEMVRAAALLGFSPSDRSRLGVGEVKGEKTALEILLDRKLGGGAASGGQSS